MLSKYKANNLIFKFVIERKLQNIIHNLKYIFSKAWFSSFAIRYINIVTFFQNILVLGLEIYSQHHRV